jgi:hypothetical protein
MKTKIIVVAFIIMCLCGNVSAYAGGDGSAGNPYQVTTANDVQNVANDLSAHYVQINDIDISHLAFTPIGEPGIEFTGSYDGQGYVINGLTIDYDFDGTGLFGYTREATLTNITITNASVYSPMDYAGVLVGDLYKGTITNCAVHGNLSCDSSGVGGLAGSAMYSTVTNSLSDVNVTAQGDKVGGLIGNVYESTINKNIALGDVTSTGIVYRTGGLIGWSVDSDIMNCAAQGNVSGYSQVGGLVGKFEGTGYNYAIQKSYSAGAVNGTLQPGGLAGYVYPAISSKVVDSYYDSTRSGQSDTGKGTPKTTAQMITLSTYSGWNFLDVWFHDVGYPVTASLTPDEFYLYPDGETFNVIAPPLLHEVTFDTYRFGANSYSVNIAKDATFAQSVYSITTNAQALTNLSRTVNLQAGEYHIRIQARDSDGQVFDTTSSTFTISQTFDLNSTSVAGKVYSLVDGIQTPLPDTLVKIYNDTWSDNFVVGSAGYYQFIDLAENQTYNIVATRDGYRDSVVNQFTASNNTTITKNIFMERETAPTYIMPHYVQFYVTNFFTWYEGVTVTVYEDNSATPYDSDTTGADGAVGFELSETVKYRVTAVDNSRNINIEHYVTPTDNRYYLVPWFSWLPEQDVTSSISYSIAYDNINLTDGYVNASYTDLSGSFTGATLNVYSEQLVLLHTYNMTSTSNSTNITLDTSNSPYIAELIIYNTELDNGYLVFKKVIDFNYGIREEFDFGWDAQWKYQLVAAVFILLIGFAFSFASAHIAALMMVLADGVFIWMGWVPRETGVLALVMLASVLAVIFLMRKQEVIR